MKKLLLPIDGSPRRRRAIQVVKQSYSPDETEVTILLVVPEARPSKMTDENDEVTPMPDHDEIVTDPQTAEEARLLVESFAKMLPAFKTETALRFGRFAAASLVCVGVPLLPMFWRIAKADYSDRYATYQTGVRQEMELTYVRKRCIKMDLSILARTFGVMVRKTGK